MVRRFEGVNTGAPRWLWQQISRHKNEQVSGDNLLSSQLWRCPRLLSPTNSNFLKWIEIQHTTCQAQTVWNSSPLLHWEPKQAWSWLMIAEHDCARRQLELSSWLLQLIGHLQVSNRLITICWFKCTTTHRIQISSKVWNPKGSRTNSDHHSRSFEGSQIDASFVRLA